MTFRSPRVMRFLGHPVSLKTGRVHGRFKGPARTDRLHRHEGVCLRHAVGLNGIKICDKFAQLLRVETTLNAPEVFKVYRRDPAPAPLKRLPLPAQNKAPLQLPHKTLTTSVAPQLPHPPRRWQRLRRTVTDMPRRAEVSRAAHARYLEALASTRSTAPLGAAVKKLCQPARKDGYRFRALNPLAQPDALLLEIISRGQWTLHGFRNADLRKHLYPSPTRSPQLARRRTAAVTRKLRLLRAHRLIRKATGSHCYFLTKQGRTLLTLLLAARRADVQQLTTLPT